MGLSEVNYVSSSQFVANSFNSVTKAFVRCTGSCGLPTPPGGPGGGPGSEIPVPVLKNHPVGYKVYELTNHLGNVITTIADRKTPRDTRGITTGSSPDGLVDDYSADILSNADYYAFGQVMPERNYAITNYRYGMNGQEKDDELLVGAMGAEYWEYDSRTGRRWNTDPVIKPWESPYACFSDNPIYYSDPLGADNDPPVKAGEVVDLGNGKKFTSSVDEVEVTALMAPRTIATEGPYKGQPESELYGGRTSEGYTVKKVKNPRELYNFDTKVSIGAGYKNFGVSWDITSGNIGLGVTGKTGFQGQVTIDRNNPSITMGYESSYKDFKTSEGLNSNGDIDLIVAGRSNVTNYFADINNKSNQEYPITVTNPITGESENILTTVNSSTVIYQVEQNSSWSYMFFGKTRGSITTQTLINVNGTQFSSPKSLIHDTIKKGANINVGYKGLGASIKTY